jgi:Methyltransferase domain
MRWQHKALAFRAFGALPGGRHLHYAAQRYVTKRIPRSPARIQAIYNGNFLAHMDAFKRYGAPLGGRLFEFGAGWDLCGNIALWCLGIERQLVVDLNRHARLRLVNHVIRHYREHGIDGAIRRPADEVGSIEALLPLYGIEYRAPWDARSMDLADRSIDMVVSTNTLEHIAPEDISAIVRECRRLCRPRAVLSMKIDYSDHWSHTDQSISPWHFLRFDDDEWCRWNPPMHYQNRLRHADYHRLFEDTGFKVLEEKAIVPDGAENAVRQMPLACRFEGYDPLDLAATAGRFVLQVSS